MTLEQGACGVFIVPWILKYYPIALEFKTKH